jgi:SAM-dependent methyltransferase
MLPEVHPTAAVGFDRGADAYGRGRPGYPPDAIRALIEVGELGPGRKVLDLAAGTGALTRPLVATGSWVLAVEPVEAMRDMLVRSIPAAHACSALAEALPFADGAVDAVTVGQAFHWFDAERATGEIHRVLREGGLLALLWNVRDETDPMQAELTALMEPYRNRTPSHRGHAWREAFADTSGFDALTLSTFPMEQRVDPDGLVDRVLSVSFMATLDEIEQVEVERRVRALARDRGAIVLPYRTDLWVTRRR